MLAYIKFRFLLTVSLRYDFEIIYTTCMCDDYQCCQVMQNIWYRSHDDDIPVLMGQPHFSPEFNNKFSMVFFLQSTKLRWSAKHYKDHLKA